MRYRELDANGDYQVGSKVRFLVNSPATIAQAINTRMKLLVNEWFLDKREGLDQSKILGVRTNSTRDLEVQQRILGTPGVTSLTQYASDVSNRGFTVTATVDTIYGTTSFTGTY